MRIRSKREVNVPERWMCSRIREHIHMISREMNGLVRFISEPLHFLSVLTFDPKQARGSDSLG